MDNSNALEILSLVVGVFGAITALLTVRFALWHDRSGGPSDDTSEFARRNVITLNGRRLHVENLSPRDRETIIRTLAKVD